MQSFIDDRSWPAKGRDLYDRILRCRPSRPMEVFLALMACADYEHQLGRADVEAQDVAVRDVVFDIERVEASILPARLSSDHFAPKIRTHNAPIARTSTRWVGEFFQQNRPAA
ncbi:MAG: hypothetical protein HY020_27060 [Burkholderiales bacterium]|nr:hypothetical protein [Burkholderiales bacterium]